MKRSIVKQGAATMMISLPSKWVKKNKLEKGNEINLEEKGNELIISSEEKKIKKETEINIGDFNDSSIRTILTNSYRLGFDKIKINFLNPKTSDRIEKIIKDNLIGFEIIKKTDRSCEIENITEPSSEQFNNIFSKILLNIDDLYDIGVSMLKGEKKEFNDTEIKIQQFYNFCLRVITKDSTLNYQLSWTFYTELIKAQREIYHMLKYLEKNNIKELKETLELLQDSKKIFELLKKAYKEKNIQDLEKIHKFQNELIYKKGYNYLNKNKDRVIIMHLLNSIRHYYFAASPLIGLIIG